MKNSLSACLLILTLLSALLTTACNRSNTGTAGSKGSPSAGARRGGNAGGGAAQGGGERRTGSGNEAKLENILDRLRQDPDSRSQILARMKSKLEQRNDDRIDERVAGLNKLFDKVLALSDKEYQDQRAHLARNMRRVLHGGTAIRGGSSGRPGGGGSGGPGGRRGQGARGPAGDEDGGAPVSAASGAPGAASGAPSGAAASGAPAPSGEPLDEDL